MILTDYFRSEPDLTWDYAVASGVDKGTIRFPDDNFDATDLSSVKAVCDRFTGFGITPMLLEPMPNYLHDHIKAGDALRDESIDKVIKMLANLDKVNIRTICFNFMAHIGWLRTNDKFVERGGAFTTEFNLDEFKGSDKKITAAELWDNYTYFIKAVMPYCEKYGVKLALHPDDPPLPALGETERIMISYANIRRAVRDIVNSDCLGVTFCQASYVMMGENIYDIIPEFKDKIFFVHFRNASGTKERFHETFHDNGAIDMARALRCYKENGVNVPIRVDHVPTYKSENPLVSGYGSTGRLFAIGYLKGLMQAIEEGEN